MRNFSEAFTLEQHMKTQKKIFFPDCKFFSLQEKNNYGISKNLVRSEIVFEVAPIP